LGMAMLVICFSLEDRFLSITYLDIS